MKCYIIDTFTDTVFKGNPAGVCVLKEWIPVDLMLNIARENNLSETAFTVKSNDIYELRWFTPGGEIDLCGHATLATGYVLMNFYDEDIIVSFKTKSGILTVRKSDDLYEIDMPSYDLKPVEVSDEMEKAIGNRPIEAWLGRDLVCIMENENQVINVRPDMNLVKALDGLLLQLSAKGANYDCVTRSFAPKLNVDEDPVCGSGHCHVVPLWSKKLCKDSLVAYQASKRTGILYCKMQENRVFISGRAVLYAESNIYV